MPPFGRKWILHNKFGYIKSNELEPDYCKNYAVVREKCTTETTAIGDTCMPEPGDKTYYYSDVYYVRMACMYGLSLNTIF